MSTAIVDQPQVTLSAMTPDEQREADQQWNSKLEYLCGRTNDVLVNIVRLHWEEGEWLNLAMKDQRKYGANVVERYVRDCEKRKIKTAVSSVYKYMDFASKYDRKEVERAIGRHITWHQLAGGGISIPTPEGRDKWELAVAAGKFDTDDDALRAAREITAAEKAKQPAKKGQKADKGAAKAAAGAQAAKTVCRSTIAICTDTIKKLDEFHDALKKIGKMDECKEKSELELTVRDVFRTFSEMQKRFVALEDTKNDLLG